MDINDVHRLAQTACDNAVEAKHLAEVAKMAGTSHEQICAERYAIINKTLDDVKQAQSLAAADQKNKNKEIFDALASIKTQLDRASGIDMTIRYIILLLGAAGIIYGFFNGGHFPAGH